MKKLIDCLEVMGILSEEEFVYLISNANQELIEYAGEKARTLATKVYGNQIYIRGLIEVSNYCKNDCYYCGIRKSQKTCQRYRLTKEDILSCCEEGYNLGFRTFVLQGGEDAWFTDAVLSDIIYSIKAKYENCAVTLSMGERSYDSYKQLFDAGADRYLLRHETADEVHYRYLHPDSLSSKHRKECLWNLKEIGYQVGTGFMVGSPGQTPEMIAKDLKFIYDLKPNMVGIGPFVPAKGTPFEKEKAGTLSQTLFLLSLIRIMLPEVLLPATTALGTIDPNGREKGILMGANVVMPNLSPKEVRKKYALYDNKLCTGEESAQGKEDLIKRMEKIGYVIAETRGDSKMKTDD